MLGLLPLDRMYGMPRDSVGPGERPFKAYNTTSSLAASNHHHHPYYGGGTATTGPYPDLNPPPAHLGDRPVSMDSIGRHHHPYDLALMGIGNGEVSQQYGRSYKLHDTGMSHHYAAAQSYQLPTSVYSNPPACPPPAMHIPTSTTPMTIVPDTTTSDIMMVMPSDIATPTTDIPRTSSSSSASVKKNTQSIPEELKDTTYWDKRLKNNDSAKRSRESRRIKEEQIAMRVVYLEQDNLQLRTEVSLLKSDIEKLRCMLYNS